MLLPVLIYLVKDDGPAEALGNLLSLGIVGFFEIDAQGQHLASVGDRDGYVLVHAPLLLVDLLDERIDLL